MRHRSLPCVGHIAVFCGHRGRLRLRGASVPFWLVVAGWRGGSLVCLWLGVWREARGGYGYMLGFTGWAYTHMHTHTHAKKVHINPLDPDKLLFLQPSTVHCFEIPEKAPLLLYSVCTECMSFDRHVSNQTCNPVYLTQ